MDSLRLKLETDRSFMRCLAKLSWEMINTVAQKMNTAEGW